MNNERSLSSLKVNIEKKIYEKEVFSIDYNLISVDAPDGAGKSTFVKVLKQELERLYGVDRVVLLAASDFFASEGARYYGDKFAHRGAVVPFSRKHNLFFLGAVNKNYREVIIQALAQNKIVVLDSSEIRALAFMMDMGSADAIDSTAAWLKSGRLTGSLLPGNRIILSIRPEDSAKNLARRPKLDHGDPTSLAEIEKRLACYQMAISEIQNLKTTQPVNWLKIDNPSEDGDVNTLLQERINDLVIPLLQGLR